MKCPNCKKETEFEVNQHNETMCYKCNKYFKVKYQISLKGI